MTTQDKIKKIVEECMKANPSKKWGYTSTCCGVYITENPQLADVLLMIQKIPESSEYTNITVNRWGEFLLDEQITGEESKGGVYTKVLIEWDLTKPLHLQSPETIDFVYGLIK